jgi:hypothetical protein
MASYSCGATTPRKLFLRTTRTPGICEIELSSTETIGAPKPYTDWPRGRTTRPCSMPGTRTFWMKTSVPVTMSGISILGGDVPTSVYWLGDFAGNCPAGMPPRKKNPVGEPML